MKRIVILVVIGLIGVWLYGGCALESPEKEEPAETAIELVDEDGYNYRLYYGEEEFSVLYWYDNWQIIDSWKITDHEDLVRICGILSEEHPIHGSDMESYRTPEDMAFEWEQHNIAYQMLPEDSPWREHARSVDLDPEDQGRTVKELYEDRTGRELRLEDFLQ